MQISNGEISADLLNELVTVGLDGYQKLIAKNGYQYLEKCLKK